MLKYSISTELAVQALHNCVGVDVTYHPLSAQHSQLIAFDSSLDTQLSILIQNHNLTGDPSTGRDIPSVDSPQAQLGMKLFYSKALSLEYNSACVSCHHPLLGGGDDLSLPIGTEAVDPDLLGPGRVHGDTGDSFYDGGIAYDHGWIGTQMIEAAIQQTDVVAKGKFQN